MITYLERLQYEGIMSNLGLFSLWKRVGLDLLRSIPTPAIL